MTWTTLDNIDIAQKTVLIRVDINVPVDSDANVTDLTRIERIAPTIRDILAMGGRPVLLAHFGRPKGKVVPEMSLRIVLPALETVLGVPVRFAEDCIGLPAKNAVAAMQPGDVVLLENTRFHKGESRNDPMFAASLAALGDIFCNDAFSAAHRAHGSTEGVARLLPSCAGRLMQAELTALENALGAPERPVTAVVGGAKVSTKLDLLGNLVEKVDHLIVGGGMANTFLVAKGYNIGTSLAEPDMAKTALEIMDKATQAGCEIVLPADIVVAREFKAHAQSRIVAADACPDSCMILDAGPQTVAKIIEVIKGSKTLLMNGPLGVFEMAPFHKATFEMLDEIARQTNAEALISVAGGGDTVGAINAAGHGDDFSYISTAGGAFLAWMEGKTLPGVAALEA